MDLKELYKRDTSNEWDIIGYPTLGYTEWLEARINDGALPNVSNRLIPVTYMIYIILWEALVIGGFGYVVFVLNYSAWWMLLAVILSAGAYKPKSWRNLLTKQP